ncbi:hypothetical protein SJZ78_12470 [Acinetobacter baumannii]|nr:hypothetical protein [Acinetobacter baumannii]MDX7906743.1 hypothetical protein [Acinetobacter baumannii]MDX7926976.1 hypothetical protein [Acinetobacter baumannii]
MQINLNKIFLKMNLTDFQKKLVWGVGVLSIISLWIVFPLIFKVLIDSYKLPDNFKDLGPFGDIYGSLNTLISSIALCAVAYSTWLQVTSLKETRETNIKQLKLAEDSHKEQLNESKHAIFSNTFDTLLNHKQDRYNGLKIRNKDDNVDYHSEEIFVEIALRFMWLLENEFIPKNYSPSEIGSKFDEYMRILGGKSRGFAEIRNYFTIYGDLLELIKRSELDENSKIFYRNIVSNSMSIHEQFTLLWVSVNSKVCSDIVNNSGIFNHFYNDDLMPFLTKFFDKSCFSHPEVISNWHKYKNSQNLT